MMGYLPLLTQPHLVDLYLSGWWRVSVIWLLYLLGWWRVSCNLASRFWCNVILLCPPVFVSDFLDAGSPVSVVALSVVRV